MSKKGESKRLKALEADFPGCLEHPEGYEYLTLIEFWVVALRHNGRTLAEIAKYYVGSKSGIGCSPARIREIEARACWKIRRNALSRR